MTQDDTTERKEANRGNSMRGAAAIVGISNIPWYKRGTAPDSEVKLAVRAVVAAAEDAEVDVRDIDGFVSWVPSRTAART